MKRWLPPLAAALLLLGAACSSGDGSSSGEGSASGDTSSEEAPFEISEEPVATTEVSLPKSYKFDPVAISIDAGDEVTWTNEDDFPHNVHLLDGSDVTEDLPIGESATIAFDEPGDYYYECSIHPDQMQGKVVVN
ncbi:MAG TPA: plastocyanin/azurin family copper-binding protein [Actinomycetota bacterium]|nr:plastocyanin/azurin family copper-binding protein [Actinomycetota bacterium]